MLEDFIETNKVKAEIINCAREVQSAKDVMDLLKVPLEKIAKTVLFIDSNTDPVLVIQSGNKRISTAKVCALINAQGIRLASAEETLEITGYEIGGVPPISIYAVKTIMDSSVAAQPEVITGGGDKLHLMRISPKTIEENVEGIIIGDVAE